MNQSIKRISIALAIVAFGLFAWYLFRPLSVIPIPAQFECLNLEDGAFIPLDSFSGKIYGMGLTYAGHIKETASDFDPDIDPPVFIKPYHTILKNGGRVAIPSKNDIKQVMDSLLAHRSPGIF